MHTNERTFTPKPGDVVVVGNLRENPRNATSNRRPPAVGLVVRVMDRDQVAVRLHVGSAFNRRPRFCRLPRIVGLGHVVRLATDRERALGYPITLETTRAA